MINYSDPHAYETIQYEVERHLPHYIKKGANDINTIVIVGAYHGYEIDRMLQYYPNATFFAFEAYPKHFEVLHDRFEGNNRVRCYNYALSDEIGVCDFYERSDPGSGSVLEFIGDQKGHPQHTVDKITANCTVLRIFQNPAYQYANIFGDIDMLWVDVQGAELLVLKGTDLTKVQSLFLEVNTRWATNEYDIETYKNNCYLDELENYLKDQFTMHSIGLDNELNNGTGNAFWIRNGYV